jgi:hypothetical protein
MSDHTSKRSDRNLSEKEQTGGTTRRTFLKSAGLVSASVASLDALHEVSDANVLSVQTKLQLNSGSTIRFTL